VLTAGTMAIALFVFGAFLLVQENLQNLLTEWGDQIQINAYLDKNLRAEEVAVLRDKIQSLSEVERVRHISREQAWKDFRTALGAHSNVLEGLPEDVCPLRLRSSSSRLIGMVRSSKHLPTGSGKKGT
jgi:cell division protein FtsX